MCGIIGILKFDSIHPSQNAELKKMLSSLQHRGPDGWGTYISDDVALGHVRLSILDISGGNQPMTTGRYIIVYNGEIFNYIELREELLTKGIRFQTKSDTEVVLRAFEHYGFESFSRFNGQFAIILWDRLKKRLVVARDRYGIRPLYVLNHNNSYYFASEMKAFDTISDYQRRFNIESLYDHALLWNSIDDDTVYQNIRSVSSGTFEVFEKEKGPVRNRYYEIGESQGNSPDNFHIANEEFKEILNDSVKIRLRSDVPVGTYLSGGIDSSVTTYLTAQIKKESFKSFSITFEDNDFDESSFQNELISQLKTDHYIQNIDYKLINDNFFNSVYHFERPVFRTAGVPLYLLSNVVRSQGMKVVLTGEGADEILWGYDSFRELKLLRFWNKQPGSKLRPLLIKRLYPHLHHYKNPKQFGLIRMYYEGFLNNSDNVLLSLNIRAHNNQIISRYFNKDYATSLNKERILDKIKAILPDNFETWSFLQQNQFLEMKTLLSGYLLSSQGDRMSMSHSVEGRYPFLDHRVVEKLFYYNDDYKLNGFVKKHLLCEAFKENIPPSIINRPKMPYTAPDLKSFFYKGTLSDQGSYFLSPDLINEYGIFDERFVSRLINKFNKGVPDQIGYRDNMLITFILSCQMANYWIRNVKTSKLDETKRNVDMKEERKTL